MNKKFLLFAIVLTFFIIGLLIFQKQSNRSLKNTDNSSISQLNLTLEECKEKEIQNLINNEYLLTEQLSVLFYTKPSIDLINNLAEKYDLEIIQVYNDPTVVFGIEKENAPLVKCQLESESEIEKVVFIESRPLPAR